ncbi:M48 family metalloprotease [Halomonas sp. DP1Y21-3]|uniref:M48 family metalloprotease n=1 Tax=Halomonas sp. DP1Y21-3 TaxID=2859080 RepID=UPI001C95B075|nr:M48 family metalloprotease [Halomonas sp. DP1Y21-3]MBY6109195.1 M48 family metalloprotease [Halomonas sp. DP1Y21-3]
MQLSKILGAASLVVGLSGCAALLEPEQHYTDVDLTIPTRDNQAIHQRDRTVLKDQSVLTYVEGILKRLEATHGKPCECQVVVDTSPGYEAYTVSANTIVLSSGAISQAESEDEVAALIGHELYHVYENDVLDSMLQDGAIAALRMGAVAAGEDVTVVFGDSLKEAATGLIYRHFEAQDEIDADAFAVDLLARAGYSQNGMNMMIRRLGEYASEARASAPAAAACLRMDDEGEIFINFTQCTSTLTGADSSRYLAKEARTEAAMALAMELPDDQRRRSTQGQVPEFYTIEYLDQVADMDFTSKEALARDLPRIERLDLPPELADDASLHSKFTAAYLMLGDHERATQALALSAQSTYRTPTVFRHLLQVADYNRDGELVAQLLHDMDREIGQMPSMLPVEYYLTRRYDLTVQEGIRLARCAMTLAQDLGLSELCDVYGDKADNYTALRW